MICGSEDELITILERGCPEIAKSFLYRLFGTGKIPTTLLSELQAEGIILSDEGVKGSIIFRDYSAPGKRFAWKRVGIVASIALTEARILALSDSKPIINVPLADERLQAMRFSLEKEETLCVSFDAGLFQPDWSGTIEYRFRTPQAKQLLELLQK